MDHTPSLRCSRKSVAASLLSASMDCLRLVKLMSLNPDVEFEVSHLPNRAGERIIHHGDSPEKSPPEIPKEAAGDLREESAGNPGKEAAKNPGYEAARFLLI
jgi:hypothetical protein